MDVALTSEFLIIVKTASKILSFWKVINFCYLCDNYLLFQVSWDRKLPSEKQVNAASHLHEKYCEDIDKISHIAIDWNAWRLCPPYSSLYFEIANFISV